MSREQLQPALYDANEWRKASRVERIYMSLVDDSERFVLTELEQVYANKLHRAFVIVSESPVFETSVRIIQDTEQVSRIKAMAIIKDMEQVYGRIRKVDKDFDRALIRETALKKIEKLSKLTGKDNLIVKYMNLIIKVGGLDKEDNVEGFDWDQLQPPNITYSDDPNVLFDDAEVVGDEEE